MISLSVLFGGIARSYHPIETGRSFKLIHYPEVTHVSLDLLATDRTNRGGGISPPHPGPGARRRRRGLCQGRMQGRSVSPMPRTDKRAFASRRGAAVSCLLLLLVALTACGGGGKGLPSGASPTRVGPVQLGISSPPPNTLEETNRQLNDIIEFDRDIQLALAVYLNHRLGIKDRQFLCAVLHTKAAKQYFKCP